MENFFEMLMVVCFGISWPLNIRKLLQSRTAKGTSVLFYFFIWIGYIFGLASKSIKAAHGGVTPAYVWFFYILNTVMVSCGILLYFRNKGLDALQKHPEGFRKRAQGVSRYIRRNFHAFRAVLCKVCKRIYYLVQDCGQEDKRQV